MLTALFFLPFDRSEGSSWPGTRRPRHGLLAAALALAVLAGGCAGSGWSSKALDLGHVDGIVKAPLRPTDGPVLAKSAVSR